MEENSEILNFTQSCCQYCCSCINIALPAALETVEVPELSLFDCHVYEMGSKLPQILVWFAQRAPLIANDNSEMSEGRLAKHSARSTDFCDKALRRSAELRSGYAQMVSCQFILHERLLKVQFTVSETQN